MLFHTRGSGATGARTLESAAIAPLDEVDFIFHYTLLRADGLQCRRVWTEGVILATGAKRGKVTRPLALGLAPPSGFGRFVGVAVQAGVEVTVWAQGPAAGLTYTRERVSPGAGDGWPTRALLAPGSAWFAAYQMRDPVWGGKLLPCRGALITRVLSSDARAQADGVMSLPESTEGAWPLPKRVKVLGVAIDDARPGAGVWKIYWRKEAP